MNGKKVRFIYNPRSGETKITDLLDEIIALYQSYGYRLMPYRLDFDADPLEMIEDVDDSFHHILIAGGDGTVNYVVNLLKRQGLDVPIACLPAGTANDFSIMLGATSNIIKTCKGILEGDIMPIDLGKANGTYFVNVFSCGLFTDISQRTPTVMKNTFGKMAYYFGGIGDLVRFRKMNIRIESDGGNYEGSSVIFFVFNGQTAGQFRIAYLSKLDDGLLDILILKGDNPRDTVATIMHYISRPVSDGKQQYPAGVEHIRCSWLRATTERREMTDIDGQPGPDFPLEITCEKSAIRVIVPKAALSKRGRSGKQKYIESHAEEVENQGGGIAD